MKVRGTSDATVRTVTERVLGRLPGHRWLWISLWASVPMVSLFVNVITIRLTGHALGSNEFLDLLAPQVVLACASSVTLSGVGLLVGLVCRSR